MAQQLIRYQCAHSCCTQEDHRDPKWWISSLAIWWPLYSSPPGQNGRHFADDIFRCIFMKEKFCVLIKTSINMMKEFKLWYADKTFILPSYLYNRNPYVHSLSLNLHCINGSVQNCDNSIANALELPQSWAKPQIWYGTYRKIVLKIRWLSARKT